MNNHIIFFQAGEVCARDCEFSKDDAVRPGGQCFGKNSERNHIFICDYDAIVALYKRGAEMEFLRFSSFKK